MIKKECLEIVEDKCENCHDCILGNTRQNIVFSSGNPERAKIMLIGEAPNEIEEEEAKPFAGRVGKLLDKFLEDAGISKQDDIYMVNTIKCRPPENRIPTDIEKSICKKYLIAQIEILNPKAIVFCGATALRAFRDDKKIQISKIRGQWFDIEINDRKIKAMAIYHPSYLLRNNSMEEGSPRRLMQEDLAKIKETILNPVNKVKFGELTMV